MTKGRDTDLPSKKEAWEKLWTRLTPLLDVHNRIRTELLSEPGPPGHLINENLVVRMAATAEAIGLKPAVITLPDDWDRGDVGIRVLFFLRNLIVHWEGRLSPNARNYEEYKEAYDKFCDYYPDAKVDEGELLKLPGQPVLTELLADVAGYILRRCPGELGPPENEPTRHQRSEA